MGIWLVGNFIEIHAQSEDPAVISAIVAGIA